MKPQYSPWGEVEFVTQIEAGVFWVGTMSHGGLMVSSQVAQAKLSQKARDLALMFGKTYCFEEDCQCDLCFLEHPDWWKRVTNRDTYDQEKILHSVKRWYPEYF